MDPEVTQRLAKVALFSGLSTSHLQRVANLGTEEHFTEGATVFREGEPGEKFYLILEGAVRISRMLSAMGEETLAILRNGSYFGEMALFDAVPRSADAIAHEPTRLFVIRKADFEDLLFVDRELAYDLLWKFVRTLSARLRETNDKMTFLSVSSKF